ncbi:MAG: hypothetical protein EBW44_08905, partial [Rhodobacteraceae bacterium]|nr:hypothetical protein [Paracoccaceae bacterium]NDD34221.1 hypothetical protein [Paracoccaceae bacterium]
NYLRFPNWLSGWDQAQSWGICPNPTINFTFQTETGKNSRPRTLNRLLLRMTADNVAQNV